MSFKHSTSHSNIFEIHGHLQFKLLTRIYFGGSSEFSPEPEVRKKKFIKILKYYLLHFNILTPNSVPGKIQNINALDESSYLKFLTITKFCG